MIRVRQIILWYWYTGCQGRNSRQRTGGRGFTLMYFTLWSPRFMFFHKSIYLHNNLLFTLSRPFFVIMHGLIMGRFHYKSHPIILSITLRLYSLPYVKMFSPFGFYSNPICGLQLYEVKTTAFHFPVICLDFV